MNEAEVKRRAFAMPLTSPAFPPGPYRFVGREFFIVTYRTDPDALREVIPAPLEMTDPIVKYEFIKMPDSTSTGFGDYTESGQVIPVSFRGQKGGYVHAMYLNDHPPIAGGRELRGFPKKLAHEPILESLAAPNFLLKIIPHVDGSPCICEIVRYFLEDITVRGAWEAPAALQLFHHALAPVASLPVLEVLGRVHLLTDMTLGLGEVVHDYLAN
jgi:acetoacetate decarboxylase